MMVNRAPRIFSSMTTRSSVGVEPSSRFGQVIGEADDVDAAIELIVNGADVVLLDVHCLAVEVWR